MRGGKKNDAYYVVLSTITILSWVREFCTQGRDREQLRWPRGFASVPSDAILEKTIVCTWYQSITGQAGISWRGVVSTYFTSTFGRIQESLCAWAEGFYFRHVTSRSSCRRSGTKYCISRSRHAPDLFCRQLFHTSQCWLLLLVDSPNSVDMPRTKHLVGLSWHLLPTLIVHSIPSYPYVPTYLLTCEECNTARVTSTGVVLNWFYS